MQDRLFGRTHLSGFSLQAIFDVLEYQYAHQLPNTAVSTLLTLIERYMRDHADRDEDHMDVQVPRTFSQVAKILEAYWVPVEQVDMCPAGCLVYNRGNEDLAECTHCGRSHWVPTGALGRRRPAASMKIFRIQHRIQRLCEVPAFRELLSWQETQYRKIQYLRAGMDK